MSELKLLVPLDGNCIGPSSDEETLKTNLNCNYEGQIPFDDLVKKLFCDDKFMCDYATGRPKYAVSIPYSWQIPENLGSFEFYRAR